MFNLDPPGCPINLKVADMRRSTVDLSWEPPSTNGGSDVTHYSVEMADVGWDHYHKVGSAIATKFTVTSLVEGKEYNIRVKALNAVGESEPAMLTQPVIPKEVLGMSQFYFM